MGAARNRPEGAGPDLPELAAMVRKLIEWAPNNVLVVLLLTAALVGFGAFAFMNVNVEAYPIRAGQLFRLFCNKL